MIINKKYEFLPEDRRKLREVTKERITRTNEEYEKVNAELIKTGTPFTDANGQQHYIYDIDLSAQLDNLQQALQRYRDMLQQIDGQATELWITHICEGKLTGYDYFRMCGADKYRSYVQANGNPFNYNLIYEDIMEMVNAVTIEDFDSFANERNALYEKSVNLWGQQTDENGNPIYTRYFPIQRTWENVYNFITNQIGEYFSYIPIEDMGINTITLEGEGYSFNAEYQGIMRLQICSNIAEKAAALLKQKAPAAEEIKEVEQYRTRIKAGEICTIPGTIADISYSDYQNGVTLYSAGSAFIQPARSMDNLEFKDGKIFFTGKLQPLSEAEIKDLRTGVPIEEIDIPLLKLLFSIIYRDFEKNGYRFVKPSYEIYIPDFAEAMGAGRKINKERTAELLGKIKKCHNAIGWLRGKREGRYNQYAILVFLAYDEDRNTVSFSSPYFEFLISTIYDVTIRKAKDGTPQFTKSGTPKFLPNYSRLVHSTITAEKNKKAVENVYIICTLVDQAGKGTPNISAETLIERNPLLKEAYGSISPINRNRELKRVFSKTWELLRTQTDLEKKYPNIQLPDPKDPATIPTTKTLDMVFSFPHKEVKADLQEGE